MVAVARSDHEITRSDIARAVEAAQAVAIPTQREVIHVIPRAYVVDGHEGIRDPIGMSGFRLEVETHIVTGEVMAIQNLIKSVQKAGVEIDDLVLQPLASGEAVLSPTIRTAAWCWWTSAAAPPTSPCLSRAGSGIPA